MSYPTKYPLVKNNNMRKYIALLAFILASFQIVNSQSGTYPEKPTAWVNDYAKLLQPDEAYSLNAKLGYYQDSTSTQIFVVTLDDHGDQPISAMAAEMAQKWGVGQKGKENGMLVLVYPADRQIFIATGYGLEEYFPDAIVKRIIETEIKPSFKNGQYYQGLDKATTVMMNLLSGVFTADQYKKSPAEGGAIGGIIFLIILFFLIFRSRSGGSRSLGRNLPFWMALGMLSSSRHSHSGSFGGFSSGGGGFGGFSGGGGGSFGGGGAGGSW
jgi:uncharacterized protein